MKIEQKKTYRTRNGLKVKITSENRQGFVGTISITYDEDGKLPGWATGHYLDIVESFSETEEGKDKEKTQES